MKKPKTSNRTTRSYSITVPSELVPVIKQMAREAGRNVSSYVSWLVAQDIRFLEKNKVAPDIVE